MENRSYTWEDYYKEFRPGKRKKILTSLLEEGNGAEDAPKDTAFAAQLFETRFTKSSSGEYVDRYMAVLMDMMNLGAHPPLFKKAGLKRLREDLDSLGFSGCSAMEESRLSMLCREMENAAGRYLETCMGDSYGKYFGAIRPSDRKRFDRIQGDVRNMTVHISERLPLEQDPELSEDLERFNRTVLGYYRQFSARISEKDPDEDDD